MQKITNYIVIFFMAMGAFYGSTPYEPQFRMRMKYKRELLIRFR